MSRIFILSTRKQISLTLQCSNPSSEIKIHFTGKGGAPFLEVLQYQVDAWSGRSKPLFHLPVPKINLIYGPRVGDVSDIKLIRTDTTLDLSQKAEKRYLQFVRPTVPIPRNISLSGFTGKTSFKYKNPTEVPLYVNNI